MSQSDGRGTIDRFLSEVDGVVFGTGFAIALLAVGVMIITFDEHHPLFMREEEGFTIRTDRKSL